jgi:uncharacterized protein YjeT (DUF2065 family)
MDVIDVRITRADYVEAITDSVYRAWWPSASAWPTSCAPPARPKARRSAPTPTASAKSPSPTPTATRRRSRARAMPRPPRIYAESFGRDPQFAQFYRSLEAYKASFNKKSDVMVLDPSGRLLQGAFRGRPGGNAGSAPRRTRQKINALDGDTFWLALALVLVFEGLFPFHLSRRLAPHLPEAAAAARRPAALLRAVQHRSGWCCSGRAGLTRPSSRPGRAQGPVFRPARMRPGQAENRLQAR